MTIKSHIALPAVVLVLMGLFIFGIGIAVNCTFIDEVIFADPVINCLAGHGYTTAAWNVTSQSETHVPTAPAYSLSLLFWLKCFGVSQFAARSLPAALALGSVLVLWRACVRAGLVKSGGAGAVVICVALLDYGYAFSYTCGRPEALSALLVAAMFYFSTLQNKRLALGAICLVSLLLPLVQWGCVIYVFFLLIALFIISREQVRPFIVAILICIAAGLLLQKMAYTHFGIWDTWMKTIRSEGSENIAKRIEYRMTWDALLHHNSNVLPKDFSALMILAGMAWLFVWHKLHQEKEEVRLAKSAWIIALMVTVGMYFVGKFPTYYSWMLSFPLAAILGAYFDRAVATNRVEAKWAMAIVILACGVGLPLQAGLAAHDWNDRNPAGITAVLEPKIGTNDVVYCDYPFYYQARQRAKTVFAGHYVNLLTQAERDSITLVIIGNRLSEWDRSKYALNDGAKVGEWRPARSGILGNDWKYGFLSAPNYDCTVYRLKEPGKP
ncbi:MAG TPA: hypothetical protein VK815_06620 [Candidatus Acidoferrales bacterium]|jgi:hypothetical protein|nr:hypothetical protein [Candidatus Acidoferrales bacterium]